MRHRLLLAPGFVALLMATPARADEAAAACVSAAAKAQRLRSAHQLVEAREQLRICAAPTCPRIVLVDCVPWLAEVEKSLPTIVVAAKNPAGADVVDVKVSVDGHPFLSRIDGQAAPLNPGVHAFHFDGPSGATLDQQVVVREGDKNQAVSVVLGSAPPPVAVVPVPVPAAPPPPVAPSPVSESPVMSEPASHAGHNRRVLGLVVGGVGVAGVVVGGIFGGVAASQWSNVKSQCPSFVGCSSSTVSEHNSAVTSAAVSTAGFIAGGVLVAAGVTIFLTAPKDPAPVVGLDIGRGAVAFRGGF